jgi:non-specific serine/threonine protein kinase/serine/threonine-protein kinase
MNPGRWDDLKRVFQAALEVPRENRSAYLRDTCADEDLRREVAALLQPEEESTQFLSDPAVTYLPEDDASAAGRRIGPFQIVRKIGEGGMGAVYLAERATDFRQSVAVKLIRADVAGAETIRRFTIERQTLAALNHPQIVRLIDGGTTEDGLPYLVVDYVEGVHIDKYCDAHQLGVEDRLKRFVEVCSAVHYAHQSLIVHCDLKPSNILVTREGVPMLLDFGIAKLLDPVSIGLSTNIANTRQRAFTPAYASPEQLCGHPVTTATDIYALGVILYELLTGRSPYAATDSAAPAAWIKSVCEEDAPAPSSTIPVNTPERSSKALRGDLDAITLKALRKDPRDRYGSVDQMAEDIRRHLSGRPVMARKNTAPYVIRKFLARHKIGVAAAAMVLLTVVAGLASTLWEARIAARRFNDVRNLAHTFLFDIHDSIQNLPGSTAARAMIAQTGTAYLDRLARDAGGDSSLQLELAEGYLKIGDVEGNQFNPNLGDTSKALESYRKALPIAESIAGQNRKDMHARRVLAQAHLDLASALPFIGNTTEALEHARKAEQLYREVWASAPDNPEGRMDMWRAYEVEGDVLGGARDVNLRHDKEAVAAYREALLLIPQPRAGDPNAERAAIARIALQIKLADMDDRAGRDSEALKQYQDGLRRAEEMAREDPNNIRTKEMVVLLLNRIASEQTALGQSNGVLENYRRAIEIDEWILAADPRNDKSRNGLVVANKNLGDHYFYLVKDVPQALRCYRRVAELLEGQARADPGNVVAQQHLSEMREEIASCLLKMGQAAEARREARLGLELAKTLADRPGATPEQVYNYAYLAITVEPEDLRDAAAVLPYARRAVEMSHDSEPFSLHVLAQTYAGSGDYRRAIEADEKALALFPPTEPGKSVPYAQESIRHHLEENREQLKRRGG